MFKFAIFMFFAMTFGYIFGRIQQFNIDESVPILFIVEKKENGVTLKLLRVISGNWVKNENLKKDGNGLFISSDRKFSMFFPVETDELKNKLVYVNSAKKSKLRNYGYLKLKFYTANRVNV